MKKSPINTTGFEIYDWTKKLVKKPVDKVDNTQKASQPVNDRYIPPVKLKHDGEWIDSPSSPWFSSDNTISSNKQNEIGSVTEAKALTPGHAGGYIKSKKK